MTHKEITIALNNLCPEADWTLSGDDYSNLIWNSDSTPPTFAQIEKEIAAIPAKQAKAKAEAEAAKAALLAKLGITADEAVLLLS